MYIITPTPTINEIAILAIKTTAAAEVPVPAGARVGVASVSQSDPSVSSQVQPSVQTVARTRTICLFIVVSLISCALDYYSVQSSSNMLYQFHQSRKREPVNNPARTMVCRYRTVEVEHVIPDMQRREVLFSSCSKRS
jgi:hypothetical protein